MHRSNGVVLLGAIPTQSGVLHDPSRLLSYWIRGALKRPPIAPIIIYDATGRKIATVDPLTKRRTPWPESDECPA